MFLLSHNHVSDKLLMLNWHELTIDLYSSNVDSIGWVLKWHKLMCERCCCNFCRYWSLYKLLSLLLLCERVFNGRFESLNDCYLAYQNSYEAIVTRKLYRISHICHIAFCLFVIWALTSFFGVWIHKFINANLRPFHVLCW